MHKPVFKNAILSGSLAKRRLCLGPAGVINCTPLKKKKKKNAVLWIKAWDV